MAQMTPRMLAAIRRATREPQPTRIPRRARPRIILTVKREPGAVQPGTITTDGHRVTLHVARWFPAPDDGSPLAEQLRAAHLLEIVAATQAGAQFARRQLNISWRLDDIAASGLLDAALAQIRRPPADGPLPPQGRRDPR